MSTINNDENIVWYKQFWPLFLVALPGSVIIACFFLIYISFAKEDDVIAKDYYQKGLNINQVLTQLDEAKKRELRLNARIENKTLIATLEGSTTDDDILTLSFSETNHQLSDISISLLRQADGSFKANLPDSFKDGRYYVDLAPLNEPTWLIKSVIFWPTESLVIAP